jgi:hypothetical protein
MSINALVQIMGTKKNTFFHFFPEILSTTMRVCTPEHHAPNKVSEIRLFHTLYVNLIIFIRWSVTSFDLQMPYFNTVNLLALFLNLSMLVSCA